MLAKDVFDLVFQGFLLTRVYATDLGWIRDQNWRLTGPYVGTIGSGLSYGGHPAVRVYYSPDGGQDYGSRIYIRIAPSLSDPGSTWINR